MLVPAILELDGGTCGGKNMPSTASPIKLGETEAARNFFHVFCRI